jgi:predicted nucleic acid-binding protein
VALRSKWAAGKAVRAALARFRIDAMIAATAILAGARLATLDKGDFKVFVPHGLKLV